MLEKTGNKETKETLKLMFDSQLQHVACEKENVSKHKYINTTGSGWLSIGGCETIKLHNKRVTRHNFKSRKSSGERETVHF